MDNITKPNPNTEGTVTARSEQGLATTATRMQNALNQITQLKQSQIEQTSSLTKAKIDPNTSKETDLNTLSFNEYQLKYGYNEQNVTDYVRNSMATTVAPQLKKQQLEHTRDSGSVGDDIADAALSLTSTGVNIVGGTVGGGALIASDPSGAVASAVGTVGKLASDFVGDDTNYEDLIIGNQGSTRSDHPLGKTLDKVSDTFAEASNNVKEFLNTNGGLKQFPELAEGLKDEPVLTKALETFGGATLEGTKVLSDWIKSGQSESLKARTQLRNEENQAYAQKLREDLGEDAGWVDNAIKNSKLLGMSALNLITDPTATLHTVVESSPYLAVSGITARIAGEAAFKKALKDKTDEITKKVNSEKLPHSNIPTLINNELAKSMDGINKIKQVSAAQAAILSTGVLEGGGAATDAYNLIIDTPFDTLEKSSERYRAMLLKEGLTPEDARKQLAIENSMGNALAVGFMASSVSKMLGVDKAINRTFGITRTPNGPIPKAVGLLADAGREGIEELVQSFLSSAATGITKRENINPNEDVYGEAAIASGEGLIAGVGTSGIFSGARVVLDGVNTATKGTSEYVASNRATREAARSIQENGTSPADLDPSSEQFNFVGTLEGIYRRNLQESTTPEEIDKNVNDANVLVNEYIERLDKLAPLLDDPNTTPEFKKQYETTKKDIVRAFDTIEKMKIKQVDQDFETNLAKAKDGDSSAATRIMGNMRTNPDSVSDTEAQALIDSGSLTPEDVEVAQKHINYVKSTKSLDEVKTDVMSGGPGFMGIQQYMNSIGSSIKVGNEAAATKALQGLKTFSARHNQKAKDFSEGLAIAQTPNKTPEQIARLTEINELYPNTSRPDLDTIHRGSGKLVETTGLEAVALLNAVELAEANIQSIESTPKETSTETEASAPVEQTEAVEEVTEAPVIEETTTESVVVTDTTDVVADSNKASPEKVSQFVSESLSKLKKSDEFEMFLNNLSKSDSKVNFQSAVASLSNAHARLALDKEVESLRVPISQDAELIAEAKKQLGMMDETTEPGVVTDAPKVSTIPRYTVETLRSNADKVYIFGDNNIRKGKGGQAIIRDEPNALGIRTKLLPNNSDAAFMTDESYNENIIKIDEDIQAILDSGKEVVFPEDGIGTGLAKLAEKAPKTFEYLNTKLSEQFDFNNGNNKALQEDMPQVDLPPLDAYDDGPQSNEVKEEVTPEVTEPVQEEVQRTPEQVQAELDTALDNGAIQEAALLANELDELNPQETIVSIPKFNQGEYLGGIVQEQGTKVEDVEAASSPAERFKQYLQENLVSKYFRVQKRDTATNNPITEVKDLMSTLASRPNEVVKAYTDITEMSIEQQALIQSLTEFHKSFSEEVLAVYSDNGRASQDQVAFLLQDGKFPEEVLAAMSSAAYNWIATGASSTLNNDVDSIKDMLGLNETDELPDGAYDTFSSGVLRNTLAEEIGKNVLKNLSLTTLSTAPGNMQTQLENSLGMLTVAALNHQKVLVHKTVPSYFLYTGSTLERFNELKAKFNTLDSSVLQGNKTPDAKEYVKLLKPTTTMFDALTQEGENGYAELHSELRRIADSTKDTSGLLNKLFKAESHRTGPTDEPVTEAKAKVRNTDQDVAPEYKETIVKHNATEHYLKDDQVKAFNSFSEAGQRSIFGYVTDMTKIQQHNVDSVNSKNRAINASLNYMSEFTEGRKSDTPFFFNHELIKNERMLLVSNTFNPQGDKLHRHMAKIEGQESTIKLNEPDPVKARNFLIAFGQSMGVKIDKMLNDDSVQIVQDLLNDPVVEAGLNAILNKEGDTFTPEQEADLLAAIKKGGEQAWSLDGLVGMAGYIQAKRNGDATYTHDLMVEADGITNGPAIGTLQFGIGTGLDDVIERLKKVGINPIGDTQEYGDYISQPTNKDNYESVTEELNNEVKTLEPKLQKVANFGLFILGDLVKVNAETGTITFQRNISKGSLMTTIYGAGLKSIKEALSKSVIDGIYDYIQDNQNDSQKLQELMNQLESNMGIRVDNSLLTKPLDFKLDFKAELNIRKGIENSLGTSMGNAIDTLYGQFKEATTWINEAMGVVAETFQQVFAHAIAMKEDEMVADGILARGRPTEANPKGAMLETLPRSEERKILETLLKAQPIVNSVLSATKEDATNEGIYVGKTKYSRAVGQQALQVRQKYNDLPYGTGSMYGSVREFISGGVGPVVLLVQNIDATTILRHLNEMVSFNVYDAIITGVDNIVGHTKNMNKHIYDINMQHDIGQEAKKAFERAEQAVKEYDAANGTNFAKEFNRDKEISIGEGFTDVVVIRDELDKAVQESTQRKQRTMSIIGRMGQYGWEKASYVVDDSVPNLVDSSIGSITDEDVINRTLGSSPLGNQGNTQYTTSTQRKVDSMNVLDVFDEVGKLGNVQETVEHSAFLRDEINTLKGQLLNDVNLHLKDTLEDTIANVEGNDIYMYTQMFGGQKNSTAILNAGLRMSAQEALAHELWHTVSRHGIEGNSKAKQELTRRWEQAKNTLEPTIFMDDPTLPESSPEYKEAKEAFDYIFTTRIDKSITMINPTTGKTETKYYSNHLHEFAAYARTNAKMIAALKTVSTDAKSDKQPRLEDGSFLNSVYNKVLDILGSVVDRLSVYLTNTKGLPQDQAVRELIKQLANIEATNKNRILNVVDTFDSSMGKLSGVVGTVAKKVNKPIMQIAESNFVKDSKSVFIRLPGRIVRILNDNAKAKFVLDAASSVQANLGKEKQGFSEQLITEARGLNENLKSFHSLSRMKTKVIDGAVLELQSNLKNILAKQFEGIDPTDKDMEAVTRGYLKTDLSSLDLDLNKILELVSDPAKVDADIATIEATLKKDAHWDHYEIQTKASGYFMATGKVTSGNLNFNAKQIAQLFGTNKANPNAARVEKSIDMLTSLYALKYTDPAYKLRLSEFIKKNLNQGTSNGMNFLQEFHREQKKKDLAEVFQGSEVNFVKGHIREEYDPNISAILAGSEEGAQYEARGWVKTELYKDKDDPLSDPIHMYVNTQGGETRTIGSIISFTSKQSKGTDTIKRRQVIGDQAPVYSGGKDTAVLFNRKERKYKAQLKRSSSFDPTKAETGMAPLYDLNGVITGYRYIMSEKTKDKTLNRDTNAINILAKGAASTLNKVETVGFNKQAIQATKEHFDANPQGNYLAIGPGVQDPELREIYARLPKEAKQNIQDIWGNKTMFVDKRVLTMLFGYRKFSLADELAKDKMNQNYAIQFLGAVNAILGKPLGYSAEQVARSTGQYWQEYVAMNKNFQIIKSGVVTIVNSISNSTQLWVEGLSVVDVLKSQKEAVVELAKYREQKAELFELEKIVELNIEPTKEKANRVRIARLKADISANPVTDVISDGLLQNIVEDVSLVDDQFTKGGKIQDAIDKRLFTKVPGFIREGARELVLSNQSFLYKKMSQSAQLSDFMARYALYKHSISKDGLGREDAANKAIDTFINYDLPTHRGIQYLNDMGFAWFTKYYIRIQRIIIKSFATKPARSIMLLVLNIMTGGAFATVFDSFFSMDGVNNRLGLPDDPIDLIGNLATASVL